LFLVFRNWIDAHLGPEFWPQTAITDIIASIAAFCGLILAAWSRRALGENWSSEVVVQSGHQLVERGPYGRIRHPMYSGLLLMLLGVAIYYGRYLWTVIFFSCLFGLYFKSRREEVLLAKALPDYEAYRQRTKALIPFVW
jgi:protein-S-isoprenylcysteine O-methyltransferase Ste14